MKETKIANMETEAIAETSLSYQFDFLRKEEPPVTNVVPQSLCNLMNVLITEIVAETQPLPGKFSEWLNHTIDVGYFARSKMGLSDFSLFFVHLHTFLTMQADVVAARRGVIINPTIMFMQSFNISHLVDENANLNYFTMNLRLDWNRFLSDLNHETNTTEYPFAFIMGPTVLDDVEYGINHSCACLLNFLKITFRMYMSEKAYGRQLQLANVDEH